MLLKLLEDKNGEVQNLAVRCLGPLVGKVGLTSPPHPITPPPVLFHPYCR